MQRPRMTTGRKILVVEDDDATRTWLVALLATAGYDVTAVDSVPAASLAFGDSDPDLLLVDARVSGYNGLQVVALRPRPIPAIVMTAFDDSTIAAEARNLGAGFLLKPVPSATLLAHIREALTRATVCARRWPRRAVRARVTAAFDAASVDIVDVSYGGVCVRRNGGAGALSGESVRCVVGPWAPVPLRIVWQRRADAATWLCGTAVGDEHQQVWCDVVDAIP